MTDGGSMMTMTYLGATRVVPMYNVMGVAKASLEASVRYLAADLGSRNIRVNAISAGPVKTASSRAIKDFSMLLSNVADRSPLRRNTEPCRSGRHRSLPGKFPRTRTHRQRPVCRRRNAYCRCVRVGLRVGLSAGRDAPATFPE